ncbi:MAG: rhomboid family intramembrane serine protease [Rhodospirillales bacterium]
MSRVRPCAGALRLGSPRRGGGEDGKGPWRGRGLGGDGARQPMLNIGGAVLWLIVANLAVHLVRLMLDERTDGALVYEFAVVAARLGGAMAWGPYDPLTLATYQFLHAGLDHLGINMLALLAFGTPVERRLGAPRFVAFYLICGLAGAGAHVLVYYDSPAPLIGASGAIAGCFGAAIRLIAGGETGRLAGLRQVGLLAALWLGSQALFGLAGGGFGSADTIAWWSHIGGFLAGLLLIGLIAPRRL